ncbi:MAG TPA: (d)CMP kinase [Planctomycetaceae bacterium]|nr:(d)CMP kinase [Planctomycetaceae bacterium]|tara:strand:+ start:4733 stop:5398 length:666 start_codon:yes stop_codon:yes gene_type:complete
MIVTIDGPAGSGKSTAARGLAQRLGFDYIDTGAMYRAVAHSCLASDIDTTDRASVTERAAELRIGFDGQDVLLDGINISAAVRSPSISEAASRVAQHPGVRAEMVRQQQAMVRERDMVTEGRDQGTEVFPDAECKFFLEASAEVRAVRRQEELLARGVEVPLEETLEQIRQRDHRDRTREISPLRPADDAIVIDSSELTADGVLDRFEAHVRQCLEDLGGS